MRCYPENVIFSYIPYGHFGSGDLPIHVNILSFLQKQVQAKYTILAEHMSPNTHFPKNVSASGQMIPTPCVSILHPPRAPQVPYTPPLYFPQYNIKQTQKHKTLLIPLRGLKQWWG